MMLLLLFLRIGTVSNSFQVQLRLVALVLVLVVVALSTFDTSFGTELMTLLGFLTVLTGLFRGTVASAFPGGSLLCSHS